MVFCMISPLVSSYGEILNAWEGARDLEAENMRMAISGWAGGFWPEFGLFKLFFSFQIGQRRNSRR